MKTPFAILGAAALGLAMPAAAQSYTTADNSVRVVERNDAGKATKVAVDGEVYDVCMSERQDSCINPRAANLDFGDYPLQYWPGTTQSDAS